MTTPSTQPDGFLLANTGPSGTFLQQLFDEIRGAQAPTAPRNLTSSQRISRPQANSCNSSTRSSSVWVGGAFIAQDAREKLRAADEVRFRTTSSPLTHRSLPRLDTSHSHSRSTSSIRNSNRPSPRKVEASNAVHKIARTAGSGFTVSPSAVPVHARAPLKGLGMPFSTCGTQQFQSDEMIPGTDSPLIICDSDSTNTASPSPSEAPTSATTDATTVSDSLSTGSHQAPGDTNAGYHARLSDTEVFLLSKKSRTVPLPETQPFTCSRLELNNSTTSHQLIGDDRVLILSPTFTERAPTLVELSSPLQSSVLPVLSSFRPVTASPQGEPQPSTPSRRSAQNSSLSDHDENPAGAETPIYARSFHLVDTSISVYKRVHGSDWMDNALCLDCYSQRSCFRRILTHGYETCGRDEELKHHYWEMALDPSN